MSETQNKTRTVPEIQQEYTSECTRAGHLQYQIVTLSKDLDMLNDHLRDLNLEAAAAQAKANAESSAPAEKGESSNG